MSSTLEHDLASANAFGRVPFPEYFGLDHSVFNEVTVRDEEMVGGAALVDLLYGDRLKFGVYHPEDRTKTKIAFHPTEHSIVFGNPQRIFEASEAGYYRTVPGNLGQQDRIKAKAARRGAHVLEKKLPDYEGVKSSSDDVVKTGRSLAKEIPNHFQSHMNEAAMRQLVCDVVVSFDHTIETVALNHEWTADQTESAILAMRKRLLAGRGLGTLETKKQYWLALIGIIDSHSLKKGSIAAARQGHAQYIINRTMKKYPKNI